MEWMDKWIDWIRIVHMDNRGKLNLIPYSKHNGTWLAKRQPRIDVNHQTLGETK